MIHIRAARCTGCGRCLETCPTGALYLVEGEIALDETLCNECGACVPVCPAEALAVVERVDLPVAVATAAADSPVISRTSVGRMNIASVAVLPALGAVLRWTAREVVPRVASYVLDSLDRREQQTSTVSLNSDYSPLIESGVAGSGRQRRRRGRRRRSL